MTARGPRPLGAAEIERAYASLSEPHPTRGGFATALLDPEWVRLGRSESGPALIFDHSEVGAVRPLQLANLLVLPEARLRLLPAGESGTYAVIQCVAADELLASHFLRLVPYVVARVVADRGAASPSDLVEELEELFRALRGSGQASLVGLWAELALLRGADDVDRAVEAYHHDATATHDFTFEGAHLEVKGTARNERVHTFSDSQLAAPEAVLVASFLLQPADTGTSLVELFVSVLELAGSVTAQEKLHRVFAAVVGGRLAEARSLRFSMPDALANRLLALGVDVPRLGPPYPVGVSGVRFASDLSLCDEAPQAEIERNELWRLLSGPHSSGGQ